LNEPDLYREWAPPPAWAHAVACCWEQRVSSTRVQRVLPDGHADVLFYDSGRIEIVGLHDEVALPVLPAGTCLRGIRFRPAAVAASFKTPASGLRNRSLPADNVLGSRHVCRLRDRVGVDAWIRSIEPSLRTSAALDLLATRPVDEVAAELAVTGRHLRRIVLAEVGLTPKMYQQVVRLQRFVRAVDAGAPLAVAAAKAGYADQPHMTRDVRRFSGLTPADLAHQRRTT
jgi:AraC-like DNA-binding protein